MLLMSAASGRLRTSGEAATVLSALFKKVTCPA
jgi:hypothetical protein